MRLILEKLRGLALGLALFAVLLLALTARAENATITWAGITVTYSNATKTTSLTGDLILTFTETNTVDASKQCMFSVSESQPAWYLLVGGGGAGGTAGNSTYGQGGGGGAGGMIDKNPVKLNAGVYIVTVGQGGAGVPSTGAGSNGSDSYLVGPDGSELECAVGGGGGGCQGLGSAGGSGGGGSRTSSTGKDGGAGTATQGNNGGRGAGSKYAGGGGGAGGAGGDGKGASGGTPALGGDGGVGKISSISGEAVYYAGGGGGGYTTGSFWPNGTQYTEDEEGTVLKENFGGGGNGSGNTVEQAASAGIDGLGGGGGGGGKVKPGARGGNGVVIVRLLMPAIQPTAKTDLIYTGEPQNAIGETPEEQGGNWDYVSGTTNETNAGNYSFVVKPKGDMKWNDDGTTNPKTITWSIGTATVDVPVPVNRTYNGSEQVGVAESPLYKLTGTPKATEVNVVSGAVAPYGVTATLNNIVGRAVPNCKWADDDPNDAKALSWTMNPKGVAVPAAIPGLAYTGSEQTGIADPAAEAPYTLAGNKGTDAQNYTATATLKDAVNYQWTGKGYGTADATIAWSIAPQAVVKPYALDNATNFVYDTTEKGIAVQPSGWTSYATMSPESVTNATAKGDYEAVFSLKSTQNYAWVGGGTDPVTLEWHITPAPVRPPKAVTGLKYTGSAQTGIIDSEDVALYAYTGSSITRWTDAATKWANVNLKDPANYCWADDGTTTMKQIPWTIAKADNAITSLKMSGWKAGTPAKSPSITATWGASTVTYYYADSEKGPWTSTECPTNPATHYVHAVIPEANNWLGAEATKKFSIWSNPEDIFHDKVEIQVKGYKGTEVLTNFPLLVRISESRFKGFYYDRAGRTGEEMTFADEKGEQLPYEVDTWNTSGESLLWVRVGTFTNNCEITMYWAVKSGQTPPGYTPEEVWTDYAAVWHFGETIDTGAAPTTFSRDATGNGYDATPRNNLASGTSLTKMVSVSSGAVGAARTIESGQQFYQGGCHLSVTNSENLLLNGAFTFSGWMNLQRVPQASEDHLVFPIARKEYRKDNKGGFAICMKGSAVTDQKFLYAHGGGSGDPQVAQFANGRTVGNGWYYFGAAYNANNAYVFGKAGATVYQTNVPLGVPGTDNGLPIVFGNSSCGTNATYTSLNGYVDEYRITPLVRNKAWLEAEYDTAHNVNFTTNSLVVKDGLKVNYWLDYPNFQPAQMAVGELPTLIYNGRLAEGLSVTNYVNVYNNTTNSELPTAQGAYRAIFGMAEPEGYELLEAEKGMFDFTYLGTSPYTKIGGTNGDSGRVLLMNRDTNPLCPVRYQGFVNKMETLNTFWERIKGPDDAVNDRDWDYYKTKNYSESILWKKGRAAKLWHLVDCRHGNTIYHEDSSPMYFTAQNYLPWSSTSYSIDGESYKATPATVGQIVMKNVNGAAVYSSCFTNGVGAIYFDAVNGWNNNINYGYYRLEVDVCTNVLGDTSGLLPPTDENIAEYSVVSNEVDGTWTTNVDYYAKAVWMPTKYIPYKRDNTPEFVGNPNAMVSSLDLNVKNGGSETNFYRIVVPLDYRGPIRFRIRRAGANTGLSHDSQTYLLLDNIVVSYPTMGADLKPVGLFDAYKGGKQTLGQETALSVPFPAINDTGVRARAVPYYYVNPGEGSENSNDFIVAANLHYRWRYLRQRAEPTATAAQLAPGHAQYYRDSFWRTVPLNPKDGFKSLEAMVIPSAVGDVEFWYELSMNVPHYEYVDYTGRDFGVPYDETKSAVTNHMTLAEMEGRSLATTGRDWFVRLREGKSDFELVEIVATGALEGVYPMEVTEDHMWRGLVRIPTNTTGKMTFFFRGKNRQTPGSYAWDENRTYWGTSGDAAVRVPSNGELKEGAFEVDITKMEIDVDNATSYYEFKMSDLYRTWEVARAEYQNFNNWNDAWSDKDHVKFKVNYGETNGVDDVTMKTYNLSDNIDSWSKYDSHPGSGWDENFGTSDEAAYPKEKFFQEHGTKNTWDGRNITFVSQSLVAYKDLTTLSGYAGKLLGQGQGSLDFIDRASYPFGLEKISFKARIGQTIAFESMTYDTLSLYHQMTNGQGYVISTKLRQNYLFLAPVNMSNWEGNNKALNKMAVGAAVSVIAYYFPGIGCYEFRVTRAEQDELMNYELFRWSLINGTMEPTRLCAQRMNRRGWTNEQNTGSDATKTNKENPSFFGMFISVNNTSAGTEIWCGFSYDSKLPVTSAGDYASYSGTAGNLNNGWYGMTYTDNSAAKLTFGGYGVAAKDCPAKFMGLCHYDAPLKGSILVNGDTTLQAGGKWFNYDRARKLELGVTPVYELANLDSGYWGYQSRLECYTNTWFTTVSCSAETRRKAHGIRMPEAPVQDAVLKLKSRTGNASADEAREWTEYGRRSVSGYGFQSFEIPLHLLGEWNLRLTTGSDYVDVVYDDIVQYQWQAPNLDNLQNRVYQNIFTQGIIVTNVTRSVNEVILQPSRGKWSTAMSVRAPMLLGMGKVSFSYADADANAEVWLQMATNQVTGAIDTLNTSVDEGDAAGQWHTIGKYAAQTKAGYDGKLTSGAGSTGGFTQYIGLHNRTDRPVKGFFRLFVPTNVVKTAVAKAEKTTDTDYGKITITGLTVTDEPALSDRAWRGWNLRTIGDKSDAEQRMYLSDTTLDNDVGNGLVGALNNSLNDIDGDKEKAVTGLPAIFSPTFGRIADYKSGVGSVRFRARLYSTSGRAETSGGGKVTLYGAKDSVDGPWTKVAEFTVEDSVFRQFQWDVTKEYTGFMAVKFEVSDPTARTTTPSFDRVVIDEISICEKVQPTVAFAYARPFRMSLLDPVEITDILSPSEQPLTGESWGVQTRIMMKQLADEIDTERGFQVFLSYYPAEKPWGWEQWKSNSLAKTMIPLEQVGEPTNYIFRSVGRMPDSLVAPIDKAGSAVQFQVMVRFFDRNGIEHEQYLETYDDWKQPDWYYPVDKNVKYGGDVDYDYFSPYTLLDTVSPGRAWINEVSWNDGTPQVNGNKKIVTNQFIEICIPTGVNMKDWTLRLTDYNLSQWTMAKFGYNGLPSQKVSTHAQNGYEFYVLESPATQAAGGVGKDESGKDWADGTWSQSGLKGSASSGTLSFGQPFQFELIRPSGVIEHQFVMGGTNEAAGKSYEYMYSATNLVKELNASERAKDGRVSPARFVAAEEISRRLGSATEFGSSGVVAGNKEGNPAPGAEPTWKSGLKFTPGRPNEGQTVPLGWFLAPNGTNAWVYFTTDAAHITQALNSEVKKSLVAVVPIGKTTNVAYRVDNWYRMAINERYATEAAGRIVAGNIGGEYVHTVAPTQTMLYVTAVEGPNEDLKTQYGLDDDNPYSDAVMKWLTHRWPGKDVDDIRLACFKGLQNQDAVQALTLTEMYWLDIPPVPETAAEEAAGSGATNWWLRGGITKIGSDHIASNYYGGASGRWVTHTNKVIDMTLYISNAVTAKAHAPDHLLGLGGESSKDFPTGKQAWTSATFKVRAKLDLSTAEKFLPFRSFTFNGGSFSSEAGSVSPALPPFSSRIEILDPRSPSSPGYTWGWALNPGTSTYFLWSIDTDGAPSSTQTLKLDDTYIYDSDRP